MAKYNAENQQYVSSTALVIDRKCGNVVKNGILGFGLNIPYSTLYYRVTAGKFGHQVYSDTHLQTV